MSIERFLVRIGSDTWTVPDREHAEGFLRCKGGNGEIIRLVPESEIAAKDAEIKRFRETIRNREQAELTALAELDEARAEIAAAVAREREACAAIADDEDPTGIIADKIRSRPTPGAAKEV